MKEIDIDFFSSDKESIVMSDRTIYTPSAFARSSLLYLQEIGSLTAQKPHVSSRCDLQSYLFFIVVSGCGTLSYSGKEFFLCKGDCAFIDCSEAYSHTTDAEALWSLKWIHFNSPTMKAVYDKYKERGGRTVFHLEAIDSFMELHKKMFAVAAGSDHLRDMLINQYLSELLTLLMGQSWHPEDQVTAKKKQNVVTVKEYIDAHYGEKITLDGLAERFFINKYYLSKIFKEQFGVNISNYLLNVRITKAKQLLRFSEKTIELIGIECGFGASHYFSQTFKSVEGVPPSEYRRQW